MSALQAVWPVELLERRRKVLDVERNLRRAIAARSLTERARITSLRLRLSEMPCAHWDVEPTDDGHGAWGCVLCHEAIVPRWVPVDEQEKVLRRAARQRAHRNAPPT